MKLKFLLLLFATFLLSGTVANAQSSSNIFISVVPPYPDPNENISVSLNSYLYNLDSVSISWSVNGKIITSGIGKKSFFTTAPDAGKEATVSATITLPDGITMEIKTVIKPSVMILLWQSNDDSYTPPFYKGKALPTPDSEVKVVAMPEIRTGSGLIDSKNMTYAWKKDYTNNVDGSGYGKNFFLFTNDYLENSNNISVTASTLDQKYSNQAYINIGTTEPKILFYKRDNNVGTVWEKILMTSHRIQGPEIVEAAPYFISPKYLQSPTLIWRWFINDSLVSLSGPKKNLMPIQAMIGVSGTSKLRLEVENRNKIFQTTNKEINIEF